jgi:hypothetical protein
MTVLVSSSGQSDRTLRMSAGTSVTCLSSMPATVGALNGRSPVSISYATTPSE